MVSNYMRFPWCREVRTKMTAQGYTVQSLSKAIGVERTRLSRVVNGSMFDPGVAEKVSDGLGGIRAKYQLS